MKLKWDISCPTYIEFLPFIYDILDSSLQEDIGKGNQVRNRFRFYCRFHFRFGLNFFQENKKMSDHLRSEEFRQYVNKYIDKLAALCYWQGTYHFCYVIVTLSICYVIDTSFQNVTLFIQSQI